MNATLRASENHAGITVAPIQPDFGAEISNVDLREPLSARAFEEIRAALVRYKVIFFRNQQITSDQQVAFARRFGEIQDYPVFQSAENPAMQGLKSRYARA